MLSKSSRKRERSSSLPGVPRVIDVASILRTCSMFQGVDDDTLANKIGPRLHLRLYRQGDLIVKEGDRGRHLFILLSGLVSVWSEKSECRLAEMTHGAVFGEIAVLYDQLRTASVRASSAHVKVAVLAREDLMAALDEDDELRSRLRDRAKAHLQSDFNKIHGGQAEAVVVSLESVKGTFQPFSKMDDDLMRLFLIDTTAFRLKKGHRFPLHTANVYLLQAGQSRLLGVGKSVAGPAGTIVDPEKDDIDVLLTSTACTIIIAPKSVYLGLLHGRIYDSDSDSEAKQHDDTIIPINSTIDWNSQTCGEPQTKRARTEGSVDEDLLNLDSSSCEELNFEGRWEFGRAALAHICDNFKGLRKLVISDWSFSVDKASLIEIKQLTHLESLTLVNIEAVDDDVIQSLPKALKQLDVSYCHRINDFSSFNHLDHLESLTMTRCSPNNATHSLPSTLQTLNLSECHLMTDSTLLHAIENLDHLISIDLSFCERLNDITCIANKKTVRILICKSIASLNDVVLRRLLESLPVVEYLDVSYNQNIHDLLGIVKMGKSLKTVIFDHCPHIDTRQATILSNLYSPTE